MWTRRQFLNRTSTAAGAALAAYNPRGLNHLLEAAAAVNALGGLVPRGHAQKGNA